MNTLYKSILAMTFAAASLPLSAQNSNLSGKVKYNDGEPLAGAYIRVKGTNKSTVSDDQGNFNLETKPGQTLIISYVGMQTKELKASQGMEIVLSDDNSLGEVMVVAFGEQKKSSFTGSAAVVGSETIAKSAVTNVVSALEGQVAGLQMTNTSGSPDSSPTLRIRGISSINAGNDPLIIVDGVPYDGGWNNINPQDVESMTVLKDAASNALYGARGANGVIMITTKKAKAGSSVVSFDAKWSSNSRGNQLYDNITNPGQYYETQYAALRNYYLAQGYNSYNAHMTAVNALGGSSSTGGLGYICYTVPEGETLIGDNGKLNPNATLGNRVYFNGEYYTIYPDNWIDETYKTSLRQEYNVNIQGQKEGFNFYVSLGYLNNDGIISNTNFDRYSARLKADYQVRSYLKVGANASYSHTESNYANESQSGGNNVFNFVSETAPIYPLYVRDAEGNIKHDSNGTVYDYGTNTEGFGIVRPFLSTENSVADLYLSTWDSNNNMFSTNGFMDITPIEGLKITINGSVTDHEYRSIYASQPFYGWGKSSYPGGYTSVYHYRNFSLNFQQLINYIRRWGKHNMTLLLGHESYKYRYEYTGGSRTKMFSYWGNQELSGAITVDGNGSYAMDYNTEGYFFRGMYDYASKYYFNLSYRRDGSSRFAKGHQWGNFYSLGGAWIVSNESFMNNTKGWLNMLKLKASVGQQGNDDINDFLYTNTYNINNFNGSTSLTLSTMGNEDITWETNTNVNAGAEFELFSNRLRGSVEFFLRKTTDMLYSVKLPLSYGARQKYANVGDMRNLGVEVELAGDVIKTNDLTWTLNLNLTQYKNAVTRLAQDNRRAELEGHIGYTSGYYFVGEGLPMYNWYIPEYAGVDPNTGVSLWYKTDDNGQKVTTKSYSEADYYNCGTAQAKFYGGFGTNLRWKNFDFGVQCSYSVGGKVYDSEYNTLMSGTYGSHTGNAIHKDVLNAWTETNRDTDIPRWQFGDTDLGQVSSRWLIDGSWLSLQNINLGYTLPAHIVKKMKISSLRFNATADNIYFWSKRQGLNPRTSTTGWIYGTTYSQMRTFTGGINLSF